MDPGYMCTATGAHTTTTFSCHYEPPKSTIIISGVTTETPGGGFGMIPTTGPSFDNPYTKTTVSITRTIGGPSTAIVTATGSPSKSASPGAAAPSLLLTLVFFLLISALLAPTAALATQTSADEEASTTVKPGQQSSLTIPTTPCSIDSVSETLAVDGGHTITPAKEALVYPTTIGISGNGGITTISGKAMMTVAAYGGAKKARGPHLVAIYLAVTIPLVLTGCLVGVEPSWLDLGMEAGGGAVLTAVGLGLGFLG